MRIEFDPAKDGSNQEKHGLSLALASALCWDDALVWIDDRFAYGEIRIIALAPDAGILYYVAFVDRDDVRRIISLRKANRREVKHYVQSFQAASGCHADRG
jgi:uncharacterized protein